PIILFIVSKFSQAEWIRRKQAIGASMPGGWMPKTLRVVEHSNAYFFPADLAIVVDPICGLTPDGFFSFDAVGTHHVIVRGAKFAGKPDGERSFFGVAHHEWSRGRGEKNDTVNDPGALVAVDGK